MVDATLLKASGSTKNKPASVTRDALDAQRGPVLFWHAAAYWSGCPQRGRAWGDGGE